MTAGDTGLAALSLLQGAVSHFMGNSIGKKDHQIRPSNLAAEIAGHFGEYLRLTAILFTDRFILTFHTFISANDDDAHVKFLQYLS